MKKRANVFKTISVILLSIVLIAFLSFYVLIVLGVSPKLQTMWVCTAMTTMNHKYLATLFISEEKIEEIMLKNKVDDSHLNSDMTNFEKKDVPLIFQRKNIYEYVINRHSKTSTTPSNFHSYLSEGYTMLEKGIYLKEVSGSTWKGYVMLISDSLRVKLRDSAKQYDEGQTVKRMVTDAKARAGINGGGFLDGVNYDSNGGSPAGLVIENGVLVNPLEQDSDTVYSMIGINSKGVLVLRHCTAKWALENDIVSAVSFSPYIVINGEGTIKNGTGGWGIAPRTAIGQRKTGEILFLVIDGRQIGWSIGCDLDVLQEIMLQEKAENAAMLDGGSSTVLFYDGDYVNKPSLGHERLINNCFIVTE